MAGTGEIGIETHVGGAAPEVPEEVITIGVQVRVISFYFCYKILCSTERDRRDYRYDDRRDSDRRDRDDRRRDDRRDERDHPRDGLRDREVPKSPEVKPSPGLKESGEYGGSTLSYLLTFHKRLRFQSHACGARVSRTIRKRGNLWMLWTSTTKP